MPNNASSNGSKSSQGKRPKTSESEEDIITSVCSNVTSDGSIPKLIIKQLRSKIPKLECSIRAPEEVTAANTSECGERSEQVQNLNPCQYNQEPAKLIPNLCIETQCVKMEKEISLQQSPTASPVINKHTEDCYYSDAEFEDRIQNVLFTKERLELELTNQKLKLPLVKGENKSKTTPSQIANHPVIRDYLNSQRLLAESMRVRFSITCGCLPDDVKAALVLEEEQRRKKTKVTLVNGSHINQISQEKCYTDSSIREQENSYVSAMIGDTSPPSAALTASIIKDIDSNNSLNSELEFGPAPVPLTNGYLCNSDYEDQPSSDLSCEIGTTGESSLDLNDHALATKTDVIPSESNNVCNGIVEIPNSEYSQSELSGKDDHIKKDHNYSLRPSLTESIDESLGRTFKDLSEADSSSSDDDTNEEQEAATTTAGLEQLATPTSISSKRKSETDDFIDEDALDYGDGEIFF